MKAQVFYSSSHIKYEDIPVPEITDDELLVKVKICGLCGTDIYKIKEETVPAGTVLGHEVVGVIEKKDINAKGFKIGERVFVSHHTPCFSCKYCKHGTFSLCPLFKSTNIEPGGFAEFIKVPKDLVKNNIIPLPDSLSDEEAVLIEPFACAWRNINRIKPQPDDTVTIIGAGPSGLMHLLLLKTMGVKRIRLVDVVGSRLQFAKKLGAENTLNIKNEKIDKFKDSDVVIVNAGNKEAVQEALDTVRVGGKISIFAQVPEGTKVPLDPNLIYHETLILGTYSSTPIEQKEIFNMFVKGKLKDATSLISHRFPFRDFQKGLKLATEAKNSCKILFYP
jgi:L-iditol 2-dehydrogenase